MTPPTDLTRRGQRLEAAFERVRDLPSDDFELQADFARYLTVLVYGYMEQSVQGLLATYITQRTSPPVARYAQRQLQRGRNLKAEALLKLLGEFDRKWRNQCEETLDGRSRDAINTVANNRNLISHGHWVGTTIAGISRDYRRIKQVMQSLANTLQSPSS